MEQKHEEMGTTRQQDFFALEAFICFVKRTFSYMPSRADALEAYADYFVRLGLRGGGILTRISFLREVVRERDDVVHLAASRNALKERCLLRTLKRWRGEDGVKFLKPLTSIATMNLILTSDPPRIRDGVTLLKWRALWYLLICTGNRPKHVRGMKGLRLEERRLLVKWGSRKYMVVPPNDWLAYPFEWTLPPPADVAAYLKEFGVPDVSCPENVASSCNSFIASLKLGLSSAERTDEKSGVTSCCPRVFLSNELQKLVERKVMTKERFNLLLDHSIESGALFYRRIDPDEESESDAE